MTLNGWLQIALFIAAVLLLAKPMGTYMAAVFERRKTFLDPVLAPCERLLYRVTGVDPAEEMRWTQYAIAMLVFSAATLLLTYIVERLQHLLPLNPQHLPGVESALALNTAISFTTNTNWQSYVPESTMSYLTQMLGLATHNFWSAAVGLALAIAFVRGIARRETKTLGNFWVDLTRGTLWVLLPISIVFALVLVSQGVVQNLRPYDTVKLVEPQTSTGTDGKPTTVTTQTIAQGPVASQEAIKMLGTNGGGFFNANSAHPFESPTPLTNFLQMLSIFLIPAGLCITLGHMVKSPKHGWAVLAAMVVLWFAGTFTSYWAESHGNPAFHNVDAAVSQTQSAGRRQHGRQGSPLRHRQLRPLRHRHHRRQLRRRQRHARQLYTARRHGPHGQHPARRGRLRRCRRGPVRHARLCRHGRLHRRSYGRPHAGVPRQERSKPSTCRWPCSTCSSSRCIILGFAAVTVLMPNLGLASLANHGPHGLSEILYAYTSATGNNGSAFAGLNANTHWYNYSLAVAMFFGRFMMIIPMLAIAGNLAGKKIAPATAGTFPVTTPLFTVLLTGVIVIVGALTFFPVLSLGPVLEHLLMRAGQLF